MNIPSSGPWFASGVKTIGPTKPPKNPTVPRMRAQRAIEESIALLIPITGLQIKRLGGCVETHSKAVIYVGSEMTIKSAPGEWNDQHI